MKWFDRFSAVVLIVAKGDIIVPRDCKSRGARHINFYMKYLRIPFLALLLYGCGSRDGSPGKSPYLEAIREVGAASDDFWVRVHAIEFLIELGDTEEASRLAESCREFETEPQKRIGYWRMKYRLSAPGEKQVWLDKILAAYLDRDGPDRIHAAETLAKLSYPLSKTDSSLTAQDLRSGGSIGAYVKWGMALPADPGSGIDFDMLLRAVEDTLLPEKRVAAYAITFLEPLPEPYRTRLLVVAEAENESSDVLPYLLHAAIIQDNPGGPPDWLKTRLRNMVEAPGKSARIAFCKALAGRWSDKEDEVLLQRVFSLESLVSESNDFAGGEIGPANQDVKIAAAFALEKRIRKK